MSIYDNLVKNESAVQIIVDVVFHFVDGAYLEILSPTPSSYTVKFIDQDKDVVVYETEISNNAWCKTNTKYFVNWRIQVFKDGDQLIFDHAYDARGKNIYISIESSSLGDTLAWLPYAEEFQKAHGCNVIVSTFLNHLFEGQYPLTFVNPGEKVENLYAMYKIGYFYDPSMEPVLPHTIPLQKQACNILGLDYKEITPRINYTNGYKGGGSKTITIATESTAGCKLWTKEAWQELINHLVDEGYTVVNVSKQGNLFEGASVLPFDPTLQSTIDTIANSHLFIGLGSGLTWLAWAIGVPVVTISNFSEEGHEFKSAVRITNTNVCHGCWNNHRYKFDKADWNWCPVHKGTDRQFECMTSITSQMVIDQIKMII